MLDKEVPLMLRKLTLALIAAAALFAVTSLAAAAPPPLTSLTVTNSCPGTPTPGGDFVTCSYSVKNDAAFTRTCSARGIYFEKGLKEDFIKSDIVLDPGETFSSDFSHRTTDTNKTHGGSFFVRVTCLDENGSQTTNPVKYTVGP
jgi:hypothetical protein